MAYQQSYTLSPGPDTTSVLSLQQQHRSTAIWDGNDPGVLTIRHNYQIFKWPLDERVRPYLITCGLHGVSRLGSVRIDHALVTALVERWRQETHTFHLPVGEATITLQDVAILLGLRIDGRPVTGPPTPDWRAICGELLGVVPDDGSLDGPGLRLSWLRDNFGDGPPPNATEHVLRSYVRAYILALLGTVLFPDKSGTHIRLFVLPLLRDLEEVGTFSWGSAVLACLYRELCRATRPNSTQISGPLILLQIWSWERINVGRPEILRPWSGRDAAGPGLPPDPVACRWRSPRSRVENPSHVLMFYRDELDRMGPDHFVWRPYSQRVLRDYPNAIHESDLWRAVSPLIYFEVVEWHRPDRVLRQFALRQQIPQECDTSAALHRYDRRGRSVSTDWTVRHAAFVAMWDQRWLNIVQGEPHREPMRPDDPYMVWYRGITRRFITDPGYRDPIRFTPSTPLVHEMARLCAGVHNQLQVVMHESSEPHPLVPEIDDMLVTQMRRLGLSHFIDTPNVEAPTSGGRMGKRRAHLAAAQESDTSEEADPTQPGADGHTDEGGVPEAPSQSQVVDPRPFVFGTNWSDLGSSSGPSAFARAARQHTSWAGPPGYDPFLGQTLEEQRRWYAEYTAQATTNPDPFASQVTQEDSSSSRQAALPSGLPPIDMPNPRLREATRTGPGMSPIGASPSEPAPRPPRDRPRRRRQC